MAGKTSVVFSVFIIFLVVVGILNIILNVEENKCEMTWMFEQPQYLRVPLPKAVNKKFPNYGLYVYGEGRYAEIVGTMKLTGVPVLFIPGNAGSYKQARSMGSVAFRRVIDKDKRFHFNFFTVDLNEEFTGLYGAVLWQQTEFVHRAIKKIFTLYKDAEFKPSTVVLVGHSMGGMIARALFTLPDFDPQTVNTVFMQATPNQAPVIVLDADLANFYEKVNTYWKNYSNSTLNHVTLVSSGGGEYDVQVRGGLTHLDGIVDDSRAVSTSTTHTPKAWVSTDHRCIVWCKQVVFGFVRSLFDIMDEKKKKIRDDPDHRISVFRHHFLQHPGTNSYITKWSSDIKLDKKIKWTVIGEQAFKWEQESVKTTTYLAIPVQDYEDVDHAVIVSNVIEDSWVCGCKLKDGEDRCSTCIDISSTGNVLPPLYSYKKVVHIDLNSDKMAGVTHILVLVPSTDKRVEVTGEIYAQDVRHLSNSLPGLMEVIMSYPESITKGTMVLDLGRAAFYKLKLYNLKNVFKVYTVRLETSKCSQKRNRDSNAGSILRFHMPWGNEDIYKFIDYGKSGNMSLKMQYIPPDPVITPYDPDFQFDAHQVQNDFVELFIHLDPTCSYKLQISMSFREMLGQGYSARPRIRKWWVQISSVQDSPTIFTFLNTAQILFVRFYGTLMPAFCVAVLLMTLVHQLRTLSKDGVCPSVLDSIWQIRPYFVVPFALLTQFVLQLKVVEKHLSNLGVPQPDIVTLDRLGISFRGAQLLLYLVALAVTTFQAVVIYLVLQFNSRLLGLTLGWLPSVVSRFGSFLAVIACLIAVALSATVCGSIGIFVCHVLGFLQLLRLCYQCRQSQDPGTKSKFHFYQTVFMIWMWLLILNSPSLLVLGKTVQSTNIIPLFSRDPSRITGTVATVAFLALILCNSPLSDKSLLGSVSPFIHIMVTQMLVFAMVMLYRVSYIIIASFVLVALTQIIGMIKSKMAPKPKTE